MFFFARLFGSAFAPAPQTPFAAGVAALAAGRPDDALAAFALALGAAADECERALVHNKRALAFLARGDRAGAVAALGSALENDDRCVPAIVNIGNLLLEDGQLGDAVAHYEAALRLDDAYGPAHHNLGIAYKRLGRKGDAVRELRRADKLAAGLRDRQR